MSNEAQGLVRNLRMDAPDKPILMAYANYADEGGYCWPGVETIAFDAGYSEETVKKTRKKLISAGWLASKRRFGTSSVTRLNLQKMAVNAADRGERTRVKAELEFDSVLAGQAQRCLTDTIEKVLPAKVSHRPKRGVPQTQVVMSDRPVEGVLQTPYSLENSQKNNQTDNGSSVWLSGSFAEEKQNQGEGAVLLRSLRVGVPVTDQVLSQVGELVTDLLVTWPSERLKTYLENECVRPGISNPLGALVAAVRRTHPLEAEKPGGLSKLVPPCGQCDARAGDPVSARVIYDDNDNPTKCRTCHPQYLSLTAA